MQEQNNVRRLNQQWDDAVDRAQHETPRTHDLGDMLTETSGLHIKSGVEAGGLWGTTSCTCADCTPSSANAPWECP
jgi:hypothetical protein